MTDLGAFLLYDAHRLTRKSPRKGFAMFSAKKWRRGFGAVCAMVWVQLWQLPLAIAQDPEATEDVAKAAETSVRDPLPPMRQLFEELAGWDFIHIDTWRIVLALVAILLGFFTRSYLLKRLLKPFEAIASRTDSELDDRIIKETRSPLGWLINTLGIYLAVMILQLPPGLQAGIILLLHTVGIVFIAWMLYNAVEVVSIVLDRFTEKTESDMDDHLVPLVRKILRVAIVAVTIITIIQQWGYDVTSLIAGLGLGGLAFALAAQQTLANLFGSIMIFTDRPFSIGDWIKTSHGEGVVEEIGLRSTKIRTFSKSLISVPNADVASTSIENFSQMNLRRIKTIIGLTYSTTPDQMDYVVEGIKTLIREDEDFFHEAYYVNFIEFSASSLDIQIYCFTNTTVWGEYMDVRQRFYLNIMRLVDQAGTGFAFPSQSLYVETPLGRYADHAPGAPPRVFVPDIVEEFARNRVVSQREHKNELGETGDGMSAE